MKFETKIIDQITRQLTVELSLDEFLKDYQKTFDKFAKKVQIDGFRKGKAPISVIKRLYETQIKTTYLEDNMNKYYKIGIEETNADPISQGKILEMKTSEETESFFIYEYEVLPVDFEYEYKNLNVDFQPEEYKEEMLEIMINKLLEDNAEEEHSDNPEETPKKIIPELNDDTAKILGYDSVDSLKETLKESILKELENNNRYVLNNQIATAFSIKNSENIKLPKAYVIRMGRNLVYQHTKGQMTDELLEKLTDDFLFNLAEKNLPALVWNVAYIKFAQDHNIVVSEDVLNERLQSIAEMYQITTEEFKTKFSGNLQNIKDEILSDCCLDYIKQFCVFGTTDDTASQEIIINTEQTVKPKRGRPKKT